MFRVILEIIRYACPELLPDRHTRISVGKWDGCRGNDRFGKHFPFVLAFLYYFFAYGRRCAMIWRHGTNLRGQERNVTK